jgi:hypothetical protein
MLTRLKFQDGSVIITAMAVMSLILMAGLATVAVVDTQSKESRTERKRESAFNLAEGLLGAQSVVLQNNWPTQPPCTTVTSDCGYAATCTPATTGATLTLQCPDAGELRGVSKIFNNVDITRNVVDWDVTVRDDVGAVAGSAPPPYQASVVNAASCTDDNAQPVVCSWDANDNKRLWVRADAKVTSEGVTRTRSLVALLQLESYSLPISGSAVKGGSVNFDNSGAKTGVDAGNGPGITVRCLSPDPNTTTGPLTAGQTSITVASASGIGRGVYLALDTLNSYEIVQVANTYTNGSTTVPLRSPGITKAHGAGTAVHLAPGWTNGANVQNTCTRWDATKTSPPPLDPPGAYTMNPSEPNALTAAQQQLVIQGADAVFDNECPPDSSDRAPNGWSGKIVITHLPAGGCDIAAQGTDTFNRPLKDEWGWIVVLDPGPAGTQNKLSLPNNSTYYGVIIVGNPNNRTDTVMSVEGNATVWGGISVDGNGRVSIGSTGGNCPPGLTAPCPSVIYDPDAWLNFTTSGAAGLVQNTWRELPPAQQ